MSEIAKTADQALRILLEVAERGPTSATELSRSLGMNRTVVHRLLSTLQHRAFVRRQDDGYVVGPVVMRLAEAVEPALRRAALPVIRRTSEEIGETIVLSAPDDREVVTVAQWLGGDHMVRVQHTIGSRHPLYLGASGRAILAFLGEPAIGRALRRLKDPQRVREQLEEIQRSGYAVSHDELQRGVYGTAAPVVDESGRAVAAVAILVPLSRMPAGNEHSECIVRAAGEIAAALFEKSDRTQVALGRA
jgi:IclR family KDG regulon transcriptional repressor